MKKNSFLLVILSIVIAGCGAKFSCIENLEGIKCEPPSKVYESYLQSKLVDTPSSVSQNAEGSDKRDVSVLLPRNIEKPIRVPPKIIKIWIAPWEDSAGDLHSGEEIYSELSPVKGRWILGEKESKETKIEVESSRDISQELPEKITEETPQKKKERKEESKEKQPTVKKLKPGE